VAREIAGRPELAVATIMMLSSSALGDEAARCRSLGIAAHLTKPINQNDLRKAVCRVLTLDAAMSAPPPDRVSPPVTSPKALRVLVAEDNVVNQRVAVGLLSRRGHHVSVVDNGREALDALAGGDFDLILMDVQMPEMDGLEATREIRARESDTGRHLRIVAMTAYAMKGDRERCFAAGMDGYLSKPIDPAMLYAILEGDAEAIDPRMLPDPDPARPLPIDSDQFMRRLGGDEQLFMDVIQLFLHDCPLRLAAIKEAVDERDPEKIRSTAHALKGAAANLSAAGLFEAAAVLERIGAEARVNAAEAGWRRLSAEAAEVMDVLRECEQSGSSGPLLSTV
jgi:CheY-like chemotaxis protein